MARINPKTSTLTVKIVYYGPGQSGKTTNLSWLHGRYPEDQRGPLIQLDTDTERTLFFDYFPATLGTLGRYRVKADLFTVPGQSFYNVTRRAVLAGADGVVFVADSAPRREEANALSLANLMENLASYGESAAKRPLVFQWNKRDVPGALSVARLEKRLNPEGRPSIPAVAHTGLGVVETQTAILAAVLQRIDRGVTEAVRRE